jgi:hypothetical protein
MQFLRETIEDLENDQSGLDLYSIDWGHKNGGDMWTSYIKANLLTNALSKLLVGKNENDYIIYRTGLIKHDEPAQIGSVDV